MVLIRPQKELQASENPLSIFCLTNRLVDTLQILEVVVLRLHGLLEVLALPDPVVPDDWDAMADGEESLVGAFVLLHDEVIEAVLWCFDRAEVLFVEVEDESRGHDTLVHETAASW